MRGTDYEIEHEKTYLYTNDEKNDTVNITLRCNITGRRKYATISVNDKEVWKE